MFRGVNGREAIDPPQLEQTQLPSTFGFSVLMGDSPRPRSSPCAGSLASGASKGKSGASDATVIIGSDDSVGLAPFLPLA